MTLVVGVGPANRTSRSTGTACERPFNVAVTAVTGPVSPETVMFDGYGRAGPEVGTVIGPVLQNVWPLTTVGLSTRWKTLPLLVRKSAEPTNVAPNLVRALVQRRGGQRRDAGSAQRDRRAERRSRVTELHRAGRDRVARGGDSRRERHGVAGGRG